MLQWGVISPDSRPATSREPDSSTVPLPRNIARLHLPGVFLVTIGVVAAFLSPVKGPELYHYARFFGHQFHDAYLTLGILTLLLLAYRARSKAAALLVVAVMGIETGLFLLLKAITWYGFHALPRPSGGDGGFPSGHTAASCALAYILTERFPRWSPVFYCAAGVIAWARVGEGSHYAYQVLAGAVLGFAVAVLVGPRFRERVADHNSESTHP